MFLTFSVSWSRQHFFIIIITVETYTVTCTMWKKNRAHFQSLPSDCLSAAGIHRFSKDKSANADVFIEVLIQAYKQSLMPVKHKCQ